MPARKVWERYGVTSMTIARWLDDENMGFPRPVYFGRFRYWRTAELEAWERDRPRRSAKPSRRPSTPEAQVGDGGSHG
jgi:predicted DNA-binding transcriptional regulator AlpA